MGEILRMKETLRNNKIATYVIVAFCAFITLILVFLSQQLQNKQAYTFSPRASETSGIVSNSNSTGRQGKSHQAPTESSSDSMFSRACCGDCANEPTFDPWQVGDTSKCQAVITCKNGKKPDTSKLFSDKECLTREQLIERCMHRDIPCDPTKIIGWPINDDQVYCDWYYSDDAERCKAGNMPVPDWDKISKIICDCDYSYTGYLISQCNECRSGDTACFDRCFQKQKDNGLCTECEKKGGRCDMNGDSLSNRKVIECDAIPVCKNESTPVSPVCKPTPSISKTSCTSLRCESNSECQQANPSSSCVNGFCCGSN